VTLKNNLIGCIWHLPYIGVFSSVGDMWLAETHWLVINIYSLAETQLLGYKSILLGKLPITYQDHYRQKYCLATFSLCFMEAGLGQNYFSLRHRRFSPFAANISLMELMNCNKIQFWSCFCLFIPSLLAHVSPFVCLASYYLLVCAF
jgi:hypothetical protein